MNTYLPALAGAKFILPKRAGPVKFGNLFGPGKSTGKSPNNRGMRKFPKKCPEPVFFNRSGATASEVDWVKAW